MQSRILVAFVAGIAVGCVCTLLGIYTYSLPGRAVQSLQDENKLLRESVKTMELERAEIQAMLKVPAEAPARDSNPAESDIFGESTPPAIEKSDLAEDFFREPESSGQAPSKSSSGSEKTSDTLDDLFNEG